MLSASSGRLAHTRSRAGRAPGQGQDRGRLPWGPSLAKGCNRERASARHPGRSWAPGWRWEAPPGPRSRVCWRRERARPAARLRGAPRNHRSAKAGTPGDGCERMLRGSRRFGSGSGAPGPAPEHLSPGRTGPGPPPTSPPPPSVPYLGPGLGGQEQRELARPAAHGLWPVGIHEQHPERGGVQVAETAREPVASPWPQSPAPSRLQAPRPAWRRRGRCAPGGCGRRLLEHPAEWAAPPSGARLSPRPALETPGQPEILQLVCRLQLPWGSFTTFKVRDTRIGTWPSVYFDSRDSNIQPSWRTIGIDARFSLESGWSRIPSPHRTLGCPGELLKARKPGLTPGGFSQNPWRRGLGISF